MFNSGSHGGGGGSSGGTDGKFRVVPKEQWASKHDVKSCQVPSCTRSFGLLGRPAHCHACGRVCCQQCVERRMSLPGYPGAEAVPVCDVCAAEITRAQREGEHALHRCHILSEMVNEQNKELDRLTSKSREMREENEGLLKYNTDLAGQVKQLQLNLKVSQAQTELAIAAEPAASPVNERSSTPLPLHQASSAGSPAATPRAATGSPSTRSGEDVEAQETELAKRKKALDARELTLSEALKKVSNDAARIASQRSQLQESEKVLRTQLMSSFEKEIESEKLRLQELVLTELSQYEKDFKAQSHEAIEALQRCAASAGAQNDSQVAAAESLAASQERIRELEAACDRLEREVTASTAANTDACRELQKAMDTLQEKYSSVSAENSDLLNKINMLKDEHRHAMDAHTEKSHDELEASLREAERRMREAHAVEVSAMLVKHEQEEKAAIAKCNEKWEHDMQLLKDSVHQLEEDKKSLARTVDVLQHSSASETEASSGELMRLHAEIRELREDSAAQLSRVREQHKAELQSLEMDHTAAVESLRKERDVAVQRAENSENDAKRTIDHLETTLQAVRTEVEASQQSKTIEHKDALESMGSSHAEALQRKEEEWAAQLRTATNSYEEKSNLLQVAHANELESLKNQHAEELEAQKQTASSRTSELETQLALITKRSSDDKMVMQNALGAVQRANTELTQQVKALQNELDTQKEEARRVQESVETSTMEAKRTSDSEHAAQLEAAVEEASKRLIDSNQEELKRIQRENEQEKERLQADIASLREEVSRVTLSAQQTVQENKQSGDALPTPADFTKERERLERDHTQQLAELVASQADVRNRLHEDVKRLKAALAEAEEEKQRLQSLCERTPEKTSPGASQPLVNRTIHSDVSVSITGVENDASDGSNQGHRVATTALECPITQKFINHLKDALIAEHSGMCDTMFIEFSGLIGSVAATLNSIVLTATAATNTSGGDVSCNSSAIGITPVANGKNAATDREKQLRRELDATLKQCRSHDERASAHAREVLELKRAGTSVASEMAALKEKLKRTERALISANSIERHLSEQIESMSRVQHSSFAKDQESSSTFDFSRNVVRAAVSYCDGVAQLAMQHSLSHFSAATHELRKEARRRRELTLGNAVALEQTTASIRALQEDLRERSIELDEWREQALIERDDLARRGEELLTRKARLMALSKGLQNVAQELKRREWDLRIREGGSLPSTGTSFTTGRAKS